MILCSKIAFLNVLTQLMDYDTLLGSTYYTPDAGIMASSRGRAVNLGETYKFDATYIHIAQHWIHWCLAII